MHIPSNELQAPGHEIDDHVLSTYRSLRLAMMWLALAFPLVLWWGGELMGVSRQSSMSAYYFAGRDLANCVFFPMRGFLVGILFAICLGLYAYKGFTERENVFLNCAAFSGFIVALWPDNLLQYQVDACPALDVVRKWLDSKPLVHDYASFSLFGFLALSVGFCAHKTLEYLPQEHDQKRPYFFWGYILLAVLMVVLPALIYSMNVSTTPPNRAVFWMEFAAIWCFATYWGVKSYELRLSKAEMLAVKNIKPAAVRALPTSTRAAL